ncbi:uncharacterized protein LOC129949205 [Eupeodes corollae]|uniref:uncharacterized protein LOC129949205 n=1 Tax=Eupeodes corollae TaxID=290404 RepID=UPI002490C3DE|nr:uncharacterized protein LOC129949205 [Eupeodes corollae]
MSINLPPDLFLLESQVAGHTIESISQKYGMLRDKLGTFVFKPLSKPLYAEREITFYKQLKEAQIHSKTQRFFPQYEGHLEMLVDGKKQLFIKLENLTHAMEKPCVMDIKVGRRTWDPLATENKIMMEEQKYQACKSTIGLCIPGFQIYDSNSECLKYGKDFGKNLNEKSFFDTLKMFLSVQNEFYKPLIKTILNQLYGLQKWFDTQTALNFFSSSILIAYDYEAITTKLKHKDQDDFVSCTSKWNNKKTEKIYEDIIPWVKVKIIDFAHVFDSENNTCDENYLFGLQNLIYMLQEILVNNW